MSDTIFPFIDLPKENEAKEDVYVPKEYAWDFENNKFILKDGKFLKVEGKEAVKVWIHKMLRTPRYRYLIYSWNYGHELEKCIGAGFFSGTVQNEVTRLLEEALFINSCIKKITDVKVNFRNDELNVIFNVITHFGEVEISV